jgi:imidazolonepropionase-like amidohydrolase
MWIQMGCLALALLGSVPQSEKDSKPEAKAPQTEKPAKEAAPKGDGKAESGANKKKDEAKDAKAKEEAQPKEPPREVLAPLAPGPTLFIRAKRVITRPGVELEDAAIVVRDGKIVAVGSGLEQPKDAQVFDAQTVCAGFIDPWSALAIDPGSLADGGLSPASKSADAFDPWGGEELRRQALRAGVTLARVQAGATARVGGTGAVVRLAPGLDERLALVSKAGCLTINVGLSANANAGGGGGGFQMVDGQMVPVEESGRGMDVFDRLADLDRIAGALEQGKSYLQAQIEYKHELAEWKKKIAEKDAELEKEFKKAKKDREKEEKDAKEKGKAFEEKKYKEDKQPNTPRYDEDGETLGRVWNGELPLFVQVHRHAELRSFFKATEPYNRTRMVLVGGSESRPFAEQLNERHMSVLVWPMLMGRGAPDEYDGADLSLAGDLARAGVNVLLGSGGADPAATRDLPLVAQMAIGHGLDADKAFEALTIGAARALDIDRQVGTVERGKDADLLLLDGRPLQGATRVLRVISAGRVVLNPEN